MNNSSEPKRLQAEPVSASGRGSVVSLDNAETFERCLQDFRDGKLASAEFHSACLHALPRHLYQIASFYYLNGDSSTECAIRVKRRLGYTDKPFMWERYLADIKSLLGAELKARHLDQRIDEALEDLPEITTRCLVPVDDRVKP